MNIPTIEMDSFSHRRPRVRISHLNALGQREFLLDEKGRAVDLADELNDPEETPDYGPRIEALAHHVATAVGRVALRPRG